MTDNPALPTVLDLLDAARQRVLTGDYAGLASLLPDLQAAEARVQGVPVAEAARLRAEAVRTGACLQAAVAGIRAGKRRVAEIDAAARGLTTYDKTGSKAVLPATVATSRRV